MPIEDLLATLPEELLSENAAPLTPSSVNDDGDDHEGTVVLNYIEKHSLFKFCMPLMPYNTLYPRKID